MNRISYILNELRIYCERLLRFSSIFIEAAVEEEATLEAVELCLAGVTAAPSSFKLGNCSRKKPRNDE